MNRPARTSHRHSITEEETTMTKLTVLLTTLALATSAWADDDHRSRSRYIVRL